MKERLLAADDDSDEYHASLEDYDDDELPNLLRLAGHHDPGVRRAFVTTLPLIVPEPSDDLVALVAVLTTDPDISVRDHACFVLAQQWREVDTEPLREALAARLDDVDRSTRSEALVGLAYRHDPRAAPRVLAALSRPSGTVWRLELLAAGALGDPDLHPLVLDHLDDWDLGDRRAAEAIRRLTDPAGVGSDLFRGVAELFRVRAHPERGPEDLEPWRVMDAMLDIDPGGARAFFVAVSTRLADDPAALDELETRSALSRELWSQSS